MDLGNLPDLCNAIRRRELSASDALSLSLDRIRATDPGVHAFLEVWQDRAQQRAMRVDQEITTGAALPLAGIAIAIKDNICTQTGKTTCASKILANYRSPYDAHVVERLEAAGAIIIGKTNL